MFFDSLIEPSEDDEGVKLTPEPVKKRHSPRTLSQFSDKIGSVDVDQQFQHIKASKKLRQPKKQSKLPKLSCDLCSMLLNKNEQKNQTPQVKTKIKKARNSFADA